MARRPKEKEPPEAYDLWAPSYDFQPQNLMLRLDDELFHELLGGVSLRDKTVVDIGCGTGRHWEKLLQQHPSQLAGFDVSDGMLTELKKKFPGAEVQLATDNFLSGISDATVDVVVSTLTIAHIQYMETALAAWARIVKPGGSIILTDFHPRLLADGGRRDFYSDEGHVVIRNFVHGIDRVIHVAKSNGLNVSDYKERVADESVRHFYEQQQAMAVYEKYKGLPLIYGIHFQKQ